MKIPTPIYLFLFLCLMIVGLGFLFGQKEGHFFLDQTLFREWDFKKKPQILIRLSPLYPDGVRVKVDLKNVRLSSICTLKETKNPVGHVHLYVNNKLYAMVFENAIDIPATDLSLDENILMVTLQSPDHRFVTLAHHVVHDRKVVSRNHMRFSWQNHKKNQTALLQDDLKMVIKRY